ncbi:MerR family transcriptional regulator [Tsukamurella soli]|uniref:HTH merR-type domain-containing protein n=1 Tax=Tsukamurella soli TaxID=644556 RepID=A0ABP8J5P2_9ACTN
MRIAELAAATGISSPSLKYYMRMGLLPSGTPVTRTESSYDTSHVARANLIRALLDLGGLSVVRIRAAIAVLDARPDARSELLGAARAALTPPTPGPVVPEWTERAARAVERFGWRIDRSDPLVATLGSQLRSLAAAGVDFGGDVTLGRWAAAAESIATVDLDASPRSPAAALRYAIVATSLTDLLLATLRRLAQQELRIRRSEALENDRPCAAEQSTGCSGMA